MMNKRTIAKKLEEKEFNMDVYIDKDNAEYLTKVIFKNYMKDNGGDPIGLVDNIIEYFACLFGNGKKIHVPEFVKDTDNKIRTKNEFMNCMKINKQNIELLSDMYIVTSYHLNECPDANFFLSSLICDFITNYEKSYKEGFKNYVTRKIHVNRVKSVIGDDNIDVIKENYRFFSNLKELGEYIAIHKFNDDREDMLGYYTDYEKLAKDFIYFGGAIEIVKDKIYAVAK